MRVRYINDLIDIGILTTGTKDLQKESQDAKDNKFLVCASEAHARYIVTSDEDLWALGEYAGTQIIPPQKFVERLDAEKRADK